MLLRLLLSLAALPSLVVPALLLLSLLGEHLHGLAVTARHPHHLRVHRVHLHLLHLLHHHLHVLRVHHGILHVHLRRSTELPLPNLLETRQPILTLMISDIEQLGIIEECQNSLVIFGVNQRIFGVLLAGEVDERELGDHWRLSHFAGDDGRSQFAAGHGPVLAECGLELFFG